MKKILFLLLLIAVPSLCFAQKQVSGIVLDSVSRNALANVHILKGTSEGISSRVDGSFNISVNKKDYLIITHIGYETERLYFDFDTMKDTVYVIVRLKKKPFAIKTVEIMPWPDANEFETDFMNLVDEPLPDRPIRNPGIPHTPGKLVPPPAKLLTSPISFLYERFGKKARTKRKMDRYRKIIEEN